MVHTFGEAQVLFLITNFHVLTGFSPMEKKTPIGDTIRFQFHRDASNPSNVKDVYLPLFNKEHSPIWIVNDDVPEADLAIIPITTTLYEDCEIKCISEQWANNDLMVRPTSNITLVGYPYGYYDKVNSLPIWKTGSVASEPKVNFDGKPLFLIDISAFPGMSGSPAFAISYGTYEMEKGGTMVGGVRKFMGIYASMQMLNKEMYLEQLVHSAKHGVRDSVSLELGNVWKADLIIDTIKKVNIENYHKEILSKM
jgi:hypothetical protein